jgi:hypothetical protein
VDVITIADIRHVTGLPAHIVNHALDRHGPAPTGRVGIARVWARSQLNDILESLRKTAAKSTLPERRTELVSA